MLRPELTLMRGYRGSLRIVKISRIPEEKNYLELHFTIKPPPPYPTPGPPEEIVYVMTEKAAIDLMEKLRLILPD